MIFIDTITTENEKMDEATSSHDEQLAHNKEKPSHPKRSNVVELWRKREGTIKSSNTVSKERSNDIKFEEKKEINRHIGLHSVPDSRQHDLSPSATLRYNSRTVGSDRNGPESITEVAFDEDVGSSKNVSVSAPRRSKIRDSWKKRAANIPSLPSPQPQPPPIAIMTTDMNSLACNYISSPQSEIASHGNSPVLDRQPSDTSVARIVTVEPIDSSTSAKRSNIRTSWRKQENVSSASLTNVSIEEQSQNGQLNSSSIEKPHSPTSHNSCITENPPNTSSNAFDELKSKWAKFGVQHQANRKKENNQLPQSTSDTSLLKPAPPAIHKNHTSETQTVKETVVDSPSKIIVQTTNCDIGEDITVQNKPVAGASPLKNSRKTRSSLSQRVSSSKVDSFQKTSPDKRILASTESDIKGMESPPPPHCDSKEITNVNPVPSETVPTKNTSRRMGSRTVRSKYARRPITTSTRNNDKIGGLTKNPSVDAIDAAQNITNPSVSTKRSPDHSLPSIEKELVPSFPLDERNQDDSNLYSNPEVLKNSGQLDAYDQSHSFVPIQSRPGADLQTTVSEKETTESVQLPKSNSKDASIAIPRSNSNQHETDEIAANESGLCSESVSNIIEESTEIRNHKNRNSSRSSLNSRASRRLRDIRQREQTRKTEENENATLPKEPHSKVSIWHEEDTPTSFDDLSQPGSAQTKPMIEFRVQNPGRLVSRPSPSIQRTRTNESYGSTLISMDNSTAFSPSVCSESTYADSQIHTSYASEFPAESASAANSKDTQRSSLHDVVPDVKEMVPDEFVSEKNANVQSFKTAYDRTSLGQIAKDMTDEASSVFDVDILNNGMHAAINKLILGDIFQKQTPKKVSRRAPSPVEEVAIEVEYVADSD